MREILFKAKRIDNGEWVEGCLSVLNDECMIAIGYRNHNELDNPHCTWVDVDKDTVSQFTGLKDKSGKLIFENDIIKIIGSGYLDIGNRSFDDNWQFIGVVKYINSLGAYIISNNTGDMYFNYLEDDTIESYEVIGNKFDNPELFEKGGAE